MIAVVVTGLVATGCGRYGFEDSGLEGLDASGPDAGGPSTNPDAAPGSPDAGAGSPDAAAGSPDAGSSFLCAATYTFTLGTSKYRLNGTDTWLSSELDCASDGAGMHLAVIDDAAELTGLIALAGANATWVGVSDRVVEGTWRSVTGGNAAVLPWSSGAPTAGGPDCVEWNPTTNQFTDVACNASRYRICECDGIAVDPSSY